METLTILTIKELKNDYNTLCSLKYGDIETFLVYQGTSILKYVMFYKNAILFQGNDFKASIFYNIDDLESIVSLLGFLTLQVGDTDSDYFKDYTKEQLEFTTSEDCELLKMLLSDFENEDSDYYKDAAKKLKKAFKRY